MKVSVVIPTYNRAPFLNRALRSVLHQDCIVTGGIEALVVDDGSTDNTWTIVSEIEKELINGHTVRYIKTPHVGQPGTARNVALKAATGDFIAYCDSDDRWLPHHLATAMKEFCKDPGLGMVANYWALAHTSVENGQIKESIIVPPHPISAVNTNCRVHKQECITRIGYFNTSQWGEDQDFFQRVEAAYKTKKTGIVTSVNGYIKGGNNLTYTFDQGVKRRYY